MTLISTLCLVGAAGLAVAGYLVASRGTHGLAFLGHRASTLPAVMAGRYVGMGVILAGLALLGAWPAVALVLAVYAGYGFYDAWVVHRVGGDIERHVIAGSLSLALSGVVAFFARGGVA